MSANRLMAGVLNKYNKISITKKVQFATVSTLVILLLAFIIITASFSYNVLLQQSLNSARKDLLHTEKKLDYLFDKVETYSLTLLSDNTVQSFLSGASGPNDSLQDPLDRLKMQKQINTIVGADKTISAVLIYDMNGKIYDSGVTLNYFDKSIYDYPLGTSIWTSTHKASYRGIFDWTLDRQVVSFIRTIGDYNTGKKIGYIEICIDERTIADLYVNEFESERLVYFISPEGQIVSHPDQSKLYQQANLKILPAPNMQDFYSSNNRFVIFREYKRMGWYILVVISQHIIFKTIIQMIRVISISGFVLMIICVFLSKFISKSITENIRKLTIAMQGVNNGNWNVHVDIDSQDEVGAMAVTFHKMLDEIQATTSRLIYEQNVKREYQLELLQQQINPHFLYNTLDNICGLAELNKKGELINMVGDITCFYRGVLSKGSIIIPLKNELTIAKSYLNIMQVRYYQSFTYNIDILESIYENTCLRLILQPILENSINHGFETHAPGGHIEITSKVFKNYIVLIVTDNGTGMDKKLIKAITENTPADYQKKSFGLINVHERIQLYFGNRFGIKIYGKPNKGTRVLIKLPKSHCNCEHNSIEGVD